MYITLCFVMTQVACLVPPWTASHTLNHATRNTKEGRYVVRFPPSSRAQLYLMRLLYTEIKITKNSKLVTT